MSTCVFCEIVKGSEKAAFIYEDDDILGFMNIHPIHPGECLLIPKAHIDHFFEIPDQIASRIMIIAQKVAKKLAEKKSRALILVEGELGAGKTEWIRAFCRAYLGKRDLIVTSPTYSLIQPYQWRNKRNVNW
jgi:histidinol-phosphate/aromatic aminotransferase/cobyric acid decarboxylase-like protein